MRIFGSPLISLNSDVLERFVLFVFFHVKPLTEEVSFVGSVEEDWVRGTTLSIKVWNSHGANVRLEFRKREEISQDKVKKIKSCSIYDTTCDESELR